MSHHIDFKFSLHLLFVNFIGVRFMTLIVEAYHKQLLFVNSNCNDFR